MSGTAPRSGPVYRRSRPEVPGSPRAVLRAVVDGVARPTDALHIAGAAKVAGCSARTVARWLELHEHVTRAGEVPTPEDAGAQVQLWLSLVDDLRAFLAPSEGEGLTEEERIAAAEKALQRAERCGCTAAVFRETDAAGRLFIAAPRCDTRACLVCQRRRLRRVVSRWAPLLRAPLVGGHHLAFVTVGSLAPVTDRAALGHYTRALGTLVKLMRRGRQSYGIEPGSWRAGTRALELVPRPEGGYSHAHLLVVRADYIPYGLHWTHLHRAACPVVTEWSRRGGGAPPPDRWPCPSCAADPAPHQLGMRALLRSLGLGEVFRDDTVGKGEEDTAAAYTEKIERYIRKVEGGEGTSGAAADLAALTWEGRRDLQVMMRGARLMEGWGDARGLLGGPDVLRRTRGGVLCAPLARVGLYDPSDEATWDRVPEGWRGLYPEEIRGLVAGDGAGDEPDVDRVTYYRTDTLETWRPWCDVDTLRVRLARMPD